MVGLVAGIVFDTLIMVVLLRLLTGAPLPWRNVRQGALLGGTVIAVMKVFGGFLISHATANPLLSAVAIPVGLLFWLNLMSRVVLLASSWAAGDVDLATLSDEARRTALATAARPPFLAPLPATVDTTLLPYAGSLAVAGQRSESPASSSGGAGHLCEQRGRSGPVLAGGRSRQHRGGRGRGGCRSRGRRSLAPPPTVTGAQVWERLTWRSEGRIFSAHAARGSGPAGAGHCTRMRRAACAPCGPRRRFRSLLWRNGR